MIRRSILSLACLLCFASLTTAQTSLQIEVFGARYGKGKVLIGLTNGRQHKMLKTDTRNADGSKLVFLMDSLPTIPVEVYVFQDENWNFKVDRTPAGIPSEPSASAAINLKPGLNKISLSLSRLNGAQKNDLKINPLDTLVPLIDSIQAPDMPTKEKHKRRRRR